MKITFSNVKAFAKSMVSRGLSDKKIEPFTKQLRVLSCFGDDELPPCEHLRESNTDGKFYCGGCGCGDRKATWLISDSDEYSKLDYPYLQCPLKMPGFSNYELSSPEESEEPITRRYYIEEMKEEDIKAVNVSDNEIPEDFKEQIRKRIQEQKEKDEKS